MKVPAMLLVLPVAASMLANAGCSTKSPSHGKRTPSSAAASPVRYYDPPRRFSAKEVQVGTGPVAVVKDTAYSYVETEEGSALVATGLATGARRWSVGLPGATNLTSGPMTEEDPPAPVAVTDGQGQVLIVAAYDTITEGTGTQQDTEQTQVLAVDPAGRTRWHRAAPGPSTALPPKIVGAGRDGNGVSVILNVGYTMAVDARSGAVLWKRDGVIPRGVDGDKVVGFRSGDDDWTSNLVALRGRDGTSLWSGPEIRTALAGRVPELVMAGSGRVVVHTSQDGRDTLFDTADGKKVTTLTPLGGLGNKDFVCEFDQRDTIVCTEPAMISGDSPEQTLAFDARSGRRLWSLPDKAAGRVALDVTCAFHGAVYGHAENGDVVVDARSGADVVTGDAALAVTDAVPGYGLVTSGGTQAHPAIG
ncbi:outer membrane protein assembly factor BamB family protein [Actinomadura litoris]|uniref:PQQ-binding-like beta-propeller repeat protein n=1 Tax=Actinomadura litoris TaxID=2678616 RepID=A0A7K1LDU3_9ACTN|nr:PQQ-binding-like beta-propeller repeat protein [Actinomadura litoris]MUN42600.1 PQQ-binding-like beta-propeller repeat protein [Actinomadura litoris]